MTKPRGPEIGGKPAYATLTMVRGDEWSRVLTLRNGSATGTPAILTGATLSVDVRKTAGGAVLVTPDVVVQSPTAGTVLLTITEEMSNALTAGVYEGDEGGCYVMTLRMIDAALQTRTLLLVTLVLLAGGDE